MKKLIVFFVVFALFSTAAFAQSPSMWLSLGAIMAKGTYDPDNGASDITTGMARLGGASFGISMQNATKTFGLSASIGFEGDEHEWQGIGGWAWWQPMPEIRFGIGNIAGGTLGWKGGDITHWSLNSTDIPHLNDVATWWYNGYAGGVLPSQHGFYVFGMDNTGWADQQMAAAISFYPLSWFGIYSPSKLGVHFYFPSIMGDSADRNSGSYYQDTLASVYFHRMEMQLTYNFYGIGDLAVAFRNSMRVRDFWENDTNDYWYDNSKGIYAQWEMNLPKNMRIEAGVNYTLAPPKKDNKFGQWPIKLGVGWRMNNFWNDESPVLTSRLGVTIPMEDYQNLIVGWDFVFNYRISAGFRLYVPVGIGLIMPSRELQRYSGGNPIYAASKRDDMLLAWTFDPYIVKDLGGPKLHVCLRLYNGDPGVLDPGWPPLGPNAPHDGSYGGGISKTNKDTIAWQVPVYLQWGF